MKKLLVLALILMFSAPLVEAQVEAGDISLLGTGTVIATDYSTSISIISLLGYYITPEMEIGFGPGITRAGIKDGQTIVSMTGYGTYNFLISGNTVPFATAGIIQSTFDPPDGYDFIDFTFFYGGGGAKIFINENVAFDIRGILGLAILGEQDVTFTLLTGISALL